VPASGEDHPQNLCLSPKINGATIRSDLSKIDAVARGRHAHWRKS